MVVIFAAFIGLIAGGLALIVFLCALPSLLKAKRDANRFGAPSTTTSVGAAIANGLARSFDFTGRANRMDFWTFAVFAAFMCGLSVFVAIGLLAGSWDDPVWYWATPLVLIPLLAIPSLSMAVRRLHDVNRSAGWLLLLLVFGYFILLFWFFQPGQEGARETAAVFE